MLLNLQGEVIGVSEGGYGFGGGFEGVGFAIPVNIASYVVKELREHGSVRRAYLGISSEPLSPDVAEKVGIGESQHGVIVTEVFPDSPAAQSEVEIGDVITHFAGIPIRTPEQLQMLVEYTRDEVLTEFRFIQNGKSYDRKVRLQPLNQATMTLDSVYGKPGYVDESLGLEVTAISHFDMQQLGYEDSTGAVLVLKVRPHSVAYFRRINPGMIIRRVGNQQISNLGEFKAAMRSQSLENGLLFLIGTPSGNHFVVLKK